MKRSLGLAELPDSISGHSYDMGEPPDGAAQWVEEVSDCAAGLKQQLSSQLELSSDVANKVTQRIPPI